MPLKDWKKVTKNVGKTLDFVKNSDVVKNVWNAGDTIEGLTDMQRKLLKWGVRGAATSTVFIGGTSIVDYTRNRVNRNLDEEENKKKLQEQKINNDKKSKARRDFEKEFAPRRGSGYYDINPGQLVLDMYNDRIGHHRMGNR